MNRYEILNKLKYDIQEHKEEQEADIEHIVITDEWEECFMHSKLMMFRDAYKYPNYENWILIDSHKTEEQRNLLIRLEKEKCSISFGLMNIISLFLGNAENEFYTNADVFSSLLGLMAFVDEYYDFKSRKDYGRFGHDVLSGVIAPGDISSWILEIDSERNFFLSQIVHCRMSLLLFLIRYEPETEMFKEINMDKQIDTEIMGTLKYGHSPCPIGCIYGDGMIEQGVRDFIKIMDWQE